MGNAPPTSVVRDGNLKATIWENEGKKGTYHTTSFAKTYEDENGNLKDINSFSNTDLLRISELARQAYTRTSELRKEIAKSPAPESPHEELTEQKDAIKEKLGNDRNFEQEPEQER